MIKTPTKEAETRCTLWHRLRIWLYLRWLYQHKDPRTL